MLFREAGAFGARLTGAGWGGCVVALVADDNIERFMSTVRRRYYNNIEDMNDAKFATAVFVTKPGAGAYFQML